MQKYFTSIFTDKTGYGLSQYNVDVCTQDEIISKVRLEKYERKYNIHAEQSKAGNCFEK